MPRSPVHLSSEHGTEARNPGSASRLGHSSFHPQDGDHGSLLADAGEDVSFDSLTSSSMTTFSPAQERQTGGRPSPHPGERNGCVVRVTMQETVVCYVGRNPALRMRQSKGTKAARRQRHKHP